MLAGLLGTARALQPDPKGYGTHTQLGLRPCALASATGRRCPTCGMTTAFAWLVRGRIDRSWQANPAGCLIAFATVPTILWLLASAVLGAPAGCRTISGPLMLLGFSAGLTVFLAWMIRWALSPDALSLAGAGIAASAWR